MAEITLRRHEYADRHLPFRCAVCGGTDEVDFVDATLQHKLSDATEYVTRWIEAQLPLCAEHANHFRRLKIINILGAVIGFAFFAIMGLIIWGIVSALGGKYTGWVVTPGLILLAAGEGCIIFFTYSKTREFITTQEIDDEGVHLSNVSPKFVRAVEKFRLDRPYKARYDDDEEEDDDDRPRRRRKARYDDDEEEDDDDDDDRPRRRRRR